MKRIPQVDALRGLAALGVCIFHLGTYHNAHYDLPQALHRIASLGEYGVQVFFVISGFVIPYSMFVAQYELRAFPRFLLKRILRIDPPYLATIALTIGLAYLAAATPGFQGERPNYTWTQLALHLGYLVDIFKSEWVVLVFWTLAIEFQYYLFMGLAFPLLASSQKRWRVLALLLSGLLALVVPQGEFVLHWLFLFMVGGVLFQYRASLLEKRAFFWWMAYCFAGCVATLGIKAALAGLVAAAVILWGKRLTSRALDELGTISYSLYLVHYPISAKAFNIFSRFTQNSILQFLVTLLAVLVAAVGFYWLVERPAKRCAAQLKYDHGRKSAASDPTPATS